MSVCRHWRTAGATFVAPPWRRTVFHRFPTVFQPFIDRLLTVFHRFSPFLPFSEKRRDDEPQVFFNVDVRANIPPVQIGRSHKGQLATCPRIAHARVCGSGFPEDYWCAWAP
jgi:hypothetical protein